MDEAFGSADTDERYVVQVRSPGGRFRGSGFFVRPHIVATCAHVVEKDADAVVIEWMGRRFRAQVLVREPKDRGSAADYPSPDIAFLGIEEVDHPIPVIDGQPVKIGGPPALVPCFTAFNSDGEVRASLQDVRITGREEGFVLLRASDVLPGMSGAPIIVDGHIRGMVKAGASGHGGSALGHGRALNGRGLRSALRRHRQQIGDHDARRPTLRRPLPGEPLHQLLSAHSEAAKRFPYRIVQLTGRRPPSLSDVYVEQRTSPRRVRGAGTVYDPHLLRPDAMLQRHRHVLLVGGAGGGKSTLLQQLAGSLADWWCGAAHDGPAASAEPPAGRVVAVLVSAADLTADEPWYEMLAGSVQRRLGGLLSERVSGSIFTRPPTPGAHWLVCVDGLDEIPDRELRDQVLGNLKFHLRRYGTRVRYLIASRSLQDDEFAKLRSGFDGAEGENRLGEYSLQEFDDEAVRSFADRWFRPASTTAGEFLDAIRTGQLSQLVRIPLMATITAMVHEQRPDRPLPIDRFGLYEQFVYVMLHLRAAQDDVHERLLHPFRQIGRAAAQYAETLVTRPEAILRFLAVGHIVRQVSVSTALREWIDECAADRPAGVLPEHIRELVCQTGLVFRTGDELDFLHRSFAEYLAARDSVESFNPLVWLADVRVDGPDSFGLFRFAAWIRAGHDPLPVIRARLHARDQLRHAHLRDVAVLIEDGGILTTADGTAIVDLTWQALRRHGGDERSVSLVHRTLSAIFGRTRDTVPLTVLLTDSRAAVHKRVEAALVLMAEGTVYEQRRAREQLVALAYRTRVSDHDRLWVLFQLAEHGGDRERDHAVQSMIALAETAPRVDVRTRAVGLLAQTGERVAALAALVRRALDPGLDIADRIAALDLFEMFQLIVDEWRVTPDEEAEGWELDDSLWRPSRPHWSMDRIEDRKVQALAVSVYGAIVQISRHDTVSASLLIGRVVRDREWAWMRRMNLVHAFDGPLAAAAESGIRLMVDDPDAEPANRVALVNRSGVLRGDRDEILRGWVRDSEGPPALRHAALDTLLRTGQAVAAEFANDRSLSVTLRIAALREQLPDEEAVRRRRARIHAMRTDCHRLRDRLFVGLTLAGLRVTETALWVRSRYRERKGRSDSTSDHHRPVGDTQGDEVAR